MSVCGEEPCPPVATDIDVLCHSDNDESTGDAWILVHLHCLLNGLCSSDSTASVCPLGLQFDLFLLSSIPDECTDSTVLADWQFCESWDHVSSVMNHVAPVQANLNLINAEFSDSLVVKTPSFSYHVTHSRVCCSSNSDDLLSNSAIERQEIVDPPCMFIIVWHFKCSPLANDHLKMIQESLQLTKHQLKQDILQDGTAHCTCF